jgi:hypothetical protein
LKLIQKGFQLKNYPRPRPAGPGKGEGSAPSNDIRRVSDQTPGGYLKYQEAFVSLFHSSVKTQLPPKNEMTQAMFNDR